MKLLKPNVHTIGIFCLLVSAVMIAQVQTEKSKESGQATVDTTVERGEVVYVSGNDLVVKMDDGQIRNFPNVPDSATVSVDGQQLSVHDLKPGMKLQRTITTTSAPQTVTKVETVTGKVWHVSPPNSVVLTLADGTNQQFKIPPGQKFNINGKETDAFGLRKGQEVSATRVTTTTKNVSSEQSKVTGEMPAPPPTEAMTGPVLIVVAVPATSKTSEVAQANPPAPPTEAQGEESQPTKKIPQTASELPLLALMGTMVLLSGVVLLAKWSRAS